MRLTRSSSGLPSAVCLSRSCTSTNWTGGPDSVDGHAGGRVLIGGTRCRRRRGRGLEIAERIGERPVGLHERGQGRHPAVLTLLLVGHVDGAGQSHDAVDVVAAVGAAEQTPEPRLQSLALSAASWLPSSSSGVSSFQKAWYPPPEKTIAVGFGIRRRPTLAKEGQDARPLLVEVGRLVDLDLRAPLPRIDVDVQVRQGRDVGRLRLLVHRQCATVRWRSRDCTLAIAGLR